MNDQILNLIADLQEKLHTAEQELGPYWVGYSDAMEEVIDMLQAPVQSTQLRVVEGDLK